MFKVTRQAVEQMLQEDPSLGTLKNQFSTDQVCALLQDADAIDSEEGLYEALMDVMYATRPQGVT